MNTCEFDCAILPIVSNRWRRAMCLLANPCSQAITGFFSIRYLTNKQKKNRRILIDPNIETIDLSHAVCCHHSFQRSVSDESAVRQKHVHVSNRRAAAPTSATTHGDRRACRRQFRQTSKCKKKRKNFFQKKLIIA